MGRLADLLKMSWTDQSASPVFAATCGAIASATLSLAGQVDGIVMIGSGYSLHSRTPFVTFDDMTVAQALKRSDPPFDSLSDSGGRRWRARQQRIYERSRGCCVASTWAAASVREDYGIPASKVHIVGVGRNVEVGSVARDWSTPRFLFVGVDWERKRGAAILDAFKVVRKRHPAATLDLVGRHPDVSMDGVRGHGVLRLDSDEGQSQYAELLQAATCFLMPSTHEPFGIAYVDAGSAGIPSIGTTVGGASEAIGPGGRLVDPADPNALIDAMLDLSEPETARRLGNLAHDHATTLTWQAVAERLLRALRPPDLELQSLEPFMDPSTNLSATFPGTDCSR